MKFLIDLQHPAHLHFFRLLARRLVHRGHEIRWTGRDKDVVRELAEGYGVDVEIFGRARQGRRLLMAIELATRMARLFWLMARNRPDVVLSIAGTYVTLPARLLRVRCCLFTDTEHATLSHRLTFPWASELYVPRAYRDPIGRPHVRYDGYHELAYLHPRHFAPDASVLDEVGLGPEDPFVLVRFVRWGAAHDWGSRGLDPEAKRACIRRLQRLSKVFVSSELPLPEDLEPLRLRLPAHRLQDLMAYSRLVFGESATMASEAAVLGVPAVFLDSVGRGYTDEQGERYGLVATLPPDDWRRALEEAEVRLNTPRETWTRAREALLEDTIDVLDLLTRISLGSLEGHQRAGAHLS